MSDILQRVLTSLPGRYAWALYKIAKKEGMLEACLSDLNNISEAIKISLISKVIKSPLLSTEECLFALKQVIGDYNFAFSESFLVQIINNKRWPEFDTIREIFQLFIDEKNMVVESIVTSYMKLSDKEEEEICSFLSELTQKNVKPKFIVDPLILGGLTFEIGRIFIDASTRKSLNNVVTQLKGNSGR